MTTPDNPTDRPGRSNRLWLAFGGLLIAVLLGGVFTLGSLNIPFAPDSRTEFIVLFALSTFNIVALFVFGLILARSLFRVWAERRAHQLGARFKTKMVLGAIGVSLLPLIFMFFISYALMNRTLNKWFSRPLEIAAEESQKLLNDLGRAEYARLQAIAAQAAATRVEESRPRKLIDADALRTESAIFYGADAAWLAGSGGAPRAFTRAIEGPRVTDAASLPRRLRVLPSGAELWQFEEQYFLTAAWRADGGDSLLAARRMPPAFAARYAQVESQLGAYYAQRQELRIFKNQILLTLALLTVLLMFSAMWFALFLSKQVTGPIQALAQGTQEVARGNLGYQVDVAARDELAVLVDSFNRMTRQLGESRQQLDEFTRSLQKAVTEIEERRKLMETILENIPTAVLSLDAGGGITRANQAVSRIFGEGARHRKTLGELAGADAAQALQQQMRKALRMGSSSRELEIALPGNGHANGRVLHAAVTVSALGTRRANPGFVVVIDDLTELLRAQKAAAWQEVAQRIAHEIKNPLTPIQISAQRLMRHLDRSTGSQATAREPELASLIGECAGLIEREVATLKSLVDEFSQFARFPTAKLVPLDANALAASALDVFTGRLDGVSVRAQYKDALPLVKADSELLRRVLVNLIDNAAEAMEGSALRELAITTRAAHNGEAIEIVVADSGHGISPEDKAKLFLPHFSTRNRGTGLGLAIASRIVTEHGGSIRVEDNSPVGARFIVRLPAAETQLLENR